MNIKKFILAVFIVFSLSFSYQPISASAKEKEVIVFIVDYREDNFTRNFIKANETKKFEVLISLTLQCMIYKNGRILFNTS